VRKLMCVLLAVAVLGPLACGNAKQDLQYQVKSSIQQKLDTDSTFKDCKLTVHSVILVSTGNGTFDGLAKVIYKGKSHDVPITVKTDRDSLIWTSQPFAFAFLLTE
jgi:hypothetical protein